MLFEVTNPAEGNKSHCGVLEFIADEGAVYMPYWVSAPSPFASSGRILPTFPQMFA
jgi:hypothetical protein